MAGRVDQRELAVGRCEGVDGNIDGDAPDSDDDESG
jgi:hypothetical protein